MTLKWPCDRIISKLSSLVFKSHRDSLTQMLDIGFVQDIEYHFQAGDDLDSWCSYPSVLRQNASNKNSTSPSKEKNSKLMNDRNNIHDNSSIRTICNQVAKSQQGRKLYFWHRESRCHTNA